MSERGLVLLADDDAGTREVVALLLEADGWTVAKAPDGREALELAVELGPDLAVVDLRMPGMSGMDLARAIAGNSEVAGLPLIAMTSDTGRLRQAAAASGLFAQVLTKPLRPGHVEEALIQSLGRDPRRCR